VLLNLRSLRKLVTTQLPEASQAAALRCLEDVTAGAERIASQTRALQTLASPSDRQDIDMAMVVSSALRLAAPTLQPRANVIHQIFPVPPVSGEPSRLGQAVLAMLLFAGSGFTSGGDWPGSFGGGHRGADDLRRAASNRIVVCVEERDGGVAVDVTDNGHALTAEEASRAFDPFFRSPSRGAGLGVGLGVARSVAATLGGGVALAPRAGGGAIITMTLPRRP
jgi:C4-dicarboxylate-specific signal transduction histidine kinase